MTTTSLATAIRRGSAREIFLLWAVDRTSPGPSPERPAHRCFRRGFTISSRAKLNKEKPRTTSVMQIPGGAKYHHMPRSIACEVYESLTIVPQLMTSGGPSPKNERNASVKIALETVRKAFAKTSGMTLGKMWRQRM